MWSNKNLSSTEIETWNIFFFLKKKYVLNMRIHRTIYCVIWYIKRQSISEKTGKIKLLIATKAAIYIFDNISSFFFSTSICSELFSHSQRIKSVLIFNFFNFCFLTVHCWHFLHLNIKPNNDEHTTHKTCQF
jgi:hypothetical protein